jgi:tRNA dimethylallyltransferase
VRDAPILVIAGPTASGKSALAIKVAQRISAEIVSADSQQLYRDFDIGTAKPSAAELAAVPHHLISAVDPKEQVSAGRYQELADEAIAGIRARGKAVVVAGGSGLYLRVLLHGVMPGPKAAPAIRARIKAEAEALGREEMHRRLAQVDPASAAKILPRDLHRIERALEIHELTGRPASAHREEHGFLADRYRYRLLVLDPPREALHDAIEARTRAMFDRGLIDEVRALVQRGYREAPAMKSVGYVQALAVVEGQMELEAAIADAARATRQYAKRQRTWFKKERGAELIQPPYAELDA